MIWCEDDDCECYRPECAAHGCMNERRTRVVDTGDELHQILGEALRKTLTSQVANSSGIREGK